MDDYNMDEGVTEVQFRQLLMALIDRGVSTGVDADGDMPVNEWYTFADAELMTNNEGLIVVMDDGSEFQVTIVRSA